LAGVIWNVAFLLSGSLVVVFARSAAGYKSLEHYPLVSLDYMQFCTMMRMLFRSRLRAHTCIHYRQKWIAIQSLKLAYTLHQDILEMMLYAGSIVGHPASSIFPSLTFSRNEQMVLVRVAVATGSVSKRKKR
jgi:hypothetical protein